MDVEIPEEFHAFIAMADRLRKYEPTRMQVNASVWSGLLLIVTNPSLSWPWRGQHFPIFGIPLTGVEIVDEVPDGIIRLPDIPEESE